MSKNNFKVISVVGIAGVVYTSAIFTPFFLDISSSVIQSLAILFIAQLLWITRVFEIPTTSLMIIILISVSLTPFETLMLTFGSGIIWLLFSTFILSGALVETGLANRISLNLLKKSRGNISLLILILLIIMTLLTFLIPTTLGRTTLISAIIFGIVSSLSTITKIDNIAKALFIGINIMGVMGGAFLMTASNSSIYALDLFRNYSSLDWSFLFWMKAFIPPIYVFMILLWGLLLYKFPNEKKHVEGIIPYIDKELEKLGTFSKGEKKILLLISLMFVLWLTEPIHGYSISMVALFIATLTMMPKVGVWNWENAKKSVNWDIIIFFGVSLMIAHTLIQTEALVFLTGFIHKVEINIYLLPFIISGISILLRAVFVNVLGFMTVMLPFGIAVANALGINPVWFIMIVFLSGGPGFFFITQTPTNLITYRYNFYTLKDFWDIGIRASFIWLIIVSLTSIFYWPMIGISALN